MEFIDDLGVFPEGQEVLLYGSGFAGQRFREVLRRHRPDVRLLGYLDSFREDAAANPPVSHVSRLPEILAKHPGAQVLITSTFYADIYAQLRQVGVQRAAVPDPMFMSKAPGFWLVGAELDTFRKRMEAIAPMFRKEQDREFCTRLWRLFSPAMNVADDAAFLLAYHARLNEQYFDFINAEAVQVAVDGGVMDGFTLLRLAHHMPQAKVYGFEAYAPAYLLSYFRGQIDRNPNYEVVLQGLMDTCGTVSIKLGESLGSTKLVQGKPQEAGAVTTTTLDVFVAERELDRLDFIKLDIEGAELPCLKGAAQSLKRFRPQLAVCLYHSPDEYHTIPAYLGSQLEDYNYYLGLYNPITYEETVLYAIPRELDRNA